MLRIVRRFSSALRAKSSWFQPRSRTSRAILAQSGISAVVVIAFITDDCNALRSAGTGWLWSNRVGFYRLRLGAPAPADTKPQAGFSVGCHCDVFRFVADISNRDPKSAGAINLHGCRFPIE